MIKRIFKILGWTILAILVALALTISLIVWYLTPEKLTPIVEREASALIDGEVKAARVELTFWSTFPHLSVSIDTLKVISHSMNDLPDSLSSSLPSNCSSLASIDYLHGSINLGVLARGRIELDDITINKPVINLVAGPDGIANYNIIKQSTDNTEKDSDSSMPDLSIDRFVIADSGFISYTSIPDSIDISLTINNIELSGKGRPLYAIAIDSHANVPILNQLDFNPLRLTVDAGIRWDSKQPNYLSVNNLSLNINEFTFNGSTRLNIGDRIVLEQLEASVRNLSVNDLSKHLPSSAREKTRTLKTDMLLNIDMSLTRPYVIEDSLSIPSASLQVEIPRCHFNWKSIHMNEVEIKIAGLIDGDDIDSSQFDIERFRLRGRALDLDMDGTVSGPVDNILIDGHLATTLRISRLPSLLLDKLPVEIDGNLSANTSMKLRTGDLKPQDFHRIYLDGHVALSDFIMMSRDSLLYVDASRADLDFGTSRTVKAIEHQIDSMLTIALTIDTTSVTLPGLKLEGANLTAALGSANRHSSTDTTMINPFGGIIRAHTLFLTQPLDSMTVRLRDINIKGALKRYNGLNRNPELNFLLDARRIGTRMPDVSMILSQPSISINAHLIPRPAQRGKGRGTVNRVRRDTTHIDNAIDWEVSNDLKTLLRRWEVKGSLKSNRAFIFMPGFPMRQRASDIDLTFNTDTVMLNNFNYKIGNTNFNAIGAITNIERALTSRTGRQKLNLQLTVDAPFIDINELSNAAFHESSGNAGPDADYDEESAYDTSSLTVDTTATKPFIVPRNIKADITVTADSLLYSQLLMHNFNGKVLVDNSSINLSELTASTEIGSASLTALYSAPDTANMQFGMGLKLNRFHIDRMLRLLPAVDSLLPALSEFAGIINAELAASSAITPSMDLDMKTFKGALKIEGDSLVLLDADTFKSLAKWLIFKNKKHNMIDHMAVEIVVDDSEVEIFPFIFDIDRYKIGVMGRNDLDMNLDYHVSVLKSPLPFKFGINIKGPLDDYKIRLGGAKIKPGTAMTYSIADTTRVNLLRQIEEIFRMGGDSNRANVVKIDRLPSFDDRVLHDTTLTHTDSVMMQRAGYLPADTLTTDTVVATTPKTKRSIFPWKKNSKDQ